MSDENPRVLELAYRKYNIKNIIRAPGCGMKKAKDIQWGKYFISASPPFDKSVQILDALDKNPAEALRGLFFDFDIVFEEKGWKYLARIDKDYDLNQAVRELEWNPEYRIERALGQLMRGEQWKSDLTSRVGKKGYNAVSTGVYTKGREYEFFEPSKLGPRIIMPTM